MALNKSPWWSHLLNRCWIEHERGSERYRRGHRERPTQEILAIILNET
jgi:hypothetical protein